MDQSNYTEKTSKESQLLLTSSELLLSASKNQNQNPVEQFGRSFSYSLLQGPVDGLAQLIEGKAGGKTEKALHLLDAPQKADAGSLNWLAQNTGAALGSVLPALLIHKGVSSALNRNYQTKATLAMSENMAALTSGQALKAGLVKAGEAGLTGAIYSGVFSPASVSEESFWEARARHAAVGGLTFASLQGSALGVKALAEKSLLSKTALSATLKSEIAANGLAGIPAGLVAANSESLLSGKGLAKADAQVESALSFALLGAGFAWGKTKLDGIAPAPRQSQSEGSFKTAGLDVDGRAIAESARNKVIANLPEYSRQDLSKVRAQVLKELGEIKALEEGKSVGAQFAESGLSISQKYRVLNSLAQVREHFVKQRAGGKIEPDQQGNWIHTQGEFGRVLDSARQGKLTALQTEDALLSSMFADSVKSKANFFTHHMEGALAADHVLANEFGAGFNRARLDGIVHAIREHQIGPPEFMSNLYANRIRQALSGNLDPGQEAALQSLKAKIAEPLKQESYRTADSGTALKLSSEETALLKLAGVNQWYVPYAENPWNKISRAVIDGDTLDNYYTPGGVGKIASLGGPESDKWFMTRRLDAESPVVDKSTNIGSSRASAQDAGKLLSEPSLELAKKASAQTEAEIAAAKDRVSLWLKQEKGIDAQKEAVPFLNSDLKYPDFGKHDSQWWNIHRMSATSRSPEQISFYEQHRYAALTAIEQEQFALAKEIRDRAALELRSAQRLDRQMPADYKPVTSQKK